MHCVVFNEMLLILLMLLCDKNHEQKFTYSVKKLCMSPFSNTLECKTSKTLNAQLLKCMEM